MTRKLHTSINQPTTRPPTHALKALVVGIIDYMRQYDIIKKMERMGKSVGMIAGQVHTSSQSTQPPTHPLLQTVDSNQQLVLSHPPTHLPTHPLA